MYLLSKISKSGHGQHFVYSVGLATSLVKMFSVNPSEGTRESKQRELLPFFQHLMTSLVLRLFIVGLVAAIFSRLQVSSKCEYLLEVLQTENYSSQH